MQFNYNRVSYEVITRIIKALIGQKLQKFKKAL